MTKSSRNEVLSPALKAAAVAALWGLVAEIALERIVARVWDGELAEYLPAVLCSIVFGMLVFLLMWRQVTRRLEREATHARAQAELRAAYDQLEVRVQERTADLAQANAALQAEILERYRAQKELAKEAQRSAALEERQRLARDLHDSLSQSLYGISLGTHAAREAAEMGAGEIIPTLDYVLSLTETALKDMRSLIHELRPESVEQEGLVAALSKHVEALCARHEIRAATDLGGEPDVLLDTKEALYRIAVEALNNTVRHSHASQAEVRLSRHNGSITLEVCDNGRGFEPSGPVPGHLGLVSMQERAAELAGTLKVETHPGRGTCVKATIPVAAPAHA